MHGKPGLLAFFLLLQGGLIQADQFEIVPGSEAAVTFDSKAPLESFQGRTSAVTGRLILDPDELNDSVDIRLEIAVDSFDTGMALRNAHMRENHLETDRYPLAIFESHILIQPHSPRFVEGRELEFEVEGNLTLHGVVREMVLPVRVTWIAKEDEPLLIIKSSFDIKLSDFKINRPKFLMMKLNDVVQVRMNLRGIPASKEK